MELTGEHKHEYKICPRCGNKFVCKVGDVGNCQCSLITLTPDEQNYLAEKYDDCLCCTCMKATRRAYALERFNARMKFILRIDSGPLK